MSKRQMTAIPATRSARSRRIREWTVVGAWIGLAALGPLSFLIAARNSSSPAPVVQSASYPVAAVAFSELVAADFLAGRSTALPSVAGVDPSFGFGPEGGQPVAYTAMTVTSTYSTAVPQSATSSARLTVVAFRVQRQGGRIIDLSVTTTLNSGGYRLLAAAPSLRVPLLGANESVDPVDYRDAPTAVRPDTAVLTSVEQWAQAFVTDDRQQLKTIIDGAAGINAPAGDYVGLGGFELTGSVRVGSLVPSLSQPGYTYGRVTVPVAEVSGLKASLDYDILLARAGTNNPRVVGWGSAGSGPRLVPFANNTGA